MKELSSFDLFFLTRELKTLIGGKIDNIYQYSKKHLAFQVFITGKGTVFFNWNNSFIFLSDKKEKDPVEMQLSKQLKKVLDQARINDVYQKGFERVLVFELSTRDEKYKLIFELFKPFNLIFLDSENKIKFLAQQAIYPKRKIKLKEGYVFPESKNNFLEIRSKEFLEIAKNSEMRTLATFLAVEMNMGGKWAEEILVRAAIDKNKKPNEMKREEAEDIISIKEEIKNENIDACINNNEALPFMFVKFDEKLNVNQTSFSEALSSIIPKQELQNPYTSIIEKQKAVIGDLKKDIELNREIGDAIYSNYEKVKSELDKHKKLRAKEIKINI